MDGHREGSQLTEEELWSIARLGFILYSRERLDEARAVFEGLTVLRADHGYAWFALGLIARDRGEPELARDYLAHAVSLDPGLHDCRVALAEVLWKSGDRAGACQALKPLELLATPGLPGAAAQRGRALLRRWLAR